MLVLDANSYLQWPHVPTTTVPGWQGEAFTHNKQVNKNQSNIVMLENLWQLNVLTSHHLGWGSTGAANLMPESATHVRRPASGSHCHRVATQNLWNWPPLLITICYDHPRVIDCQMQLSLRFNFPIPVSWLGEWSEGRDSAEVSWFDPIILFNYPIYPIILFKQTNKQTVRLLIDRM